MVQLATGAWTLLAVGALIGLLGCPEVPRTRSQSTAPASAATAPTSATAAAKSQRAGHPIGKRIELQRTAMGTTVTLASYTSAALDQEAVRQALDRAHQEVSRLERLMTTWREDSEVSRINAVAGRHAVGVSSETFGVIAKSQWISKRSQGAFDITFASMGKLWRFDEDLVAELPDPAAVTLARARIDYRRIKLDEADKTVMLERPDTRINLGGIAKGYAIDRAAAVLRQAGLEAFFAQAGGDLYVEGRKPNGEAWRVGVRDPRGSNGSYFAMLPVEDHAFSTAGDYERAFVKGGKRYHHIIDPRTGYPATASRSVTIWAKDALTADAIDDAVFILGPSEGLALVESLDDCGALIVDQNNKVWISKRLEGRVEIRHQPTGGI
ncbi:MAG: FAD:protein FMN transferase [Deltaproteobacteria bacterium]|nr:MAG: FAD:protein FMN transferase [Deltaproteobacteria bacterium]